MPTTGKTLRVLIVDDNRDGADAMGLLLEELGHQVHVTYGGKQALDVATAFRADLLLVDLVMPEMDGCGLATHIRELPNFSHAKIVAITGHSDVQRKASAQKAGFDAFLVKPIPLSAIKAALNSVVVTDEGPAKKRRTKIGRLENAGRLPIEDARRIRTDRKSKSLTQAESEAAICDGIVRFQEEFMGRRSELIHVHFIKDLLLVRIRGVLTLAERQLGKSSTPEHGRDLIKQTRKQLLELARPMLESLIHEVAGVKVLSMHHDISTVTGEEVVLFSLVAAPRFCAEEETT